jgi:hypothetical protein
MRLFGLRSKVERIGGNRVPKEGKVALHPKTAGKANATMEQTRMARYAKDWLSLHRRLLHSLFGPKRPLPHQHDAGF